MDYSKLFPQSLGQGRGGISRKTARALAQVYIDSFAHRFDAMSRLEVDHAALYDFLYENDYPVWFADDSERYIDERAVRLWIMRLQTGETLKDIFPYLEAEQLHELGQVYLRKLAEDIVNNQIEELEEGLGSPEWHDYPESTRHLWRRLELDGFVYRDSKFLKTESSVLEEKEEQGVLESLYATCGLDNEETAFHHLSLSEQHYTAERWDDSISNSRKFLENVLREVAATHSWQSHNSALPQKMYSRPVEVRTYLESEGLIDSQEKEAVSKVYSLLSGTGGHPYMARADQARLLRNLALILSQFVMLRFLGSVKQP